jgi:hypothetical protein
VVTPRKIFDWSDARDVRLRSIAHNDAGVIPGTTVGKSFDVQLRIVFIDNLSRHIGTALREMQSVSAKLLRI